MTTHQPQIEAHRLEANKQRRVPSPLLTTKTKKNAEFILSAGQLERRETLYQANSKSLTSEITGFTGLQMRGSESYDDYLAREFKQASKILNTELDTLAHTQEQFLRGTRAPTIIVDRDYALVMVMRAFADYLRFKPTIE